MTQLFDTIYTLIVTEDGGLTTAGYAIFIIIAVLALGLAVFLLPEKSGGKSTAKRLVFCSAALALAVVFSFIKFHILGGSITLCSMFFIVIIGYWYGPRTGLLAAFTYGILQFLQGPYIISPLQVGCDYLIAFTCLGLSGFFRKLKNGLWTGYAISVFMRGVFHSIGGYLFWMEYMPEDFPKALAWAYPIIANFAYLIPEAIITFVIFSLPPSKSALKQTAQMIRN